MASASACCARTRDFKQTIEGQSDHAGGLQIRPACPAQKAQLEGQLLPGAAVRQAWRTSCHVFGAWLKLGACEQVVVAIRGTSSLRDAVTDAVGQPLDIAPWMGDDMPVRLLPS